MPHSYSMVHVKQETGKNQFLELDLNFMPVILTFSRGMDLYTGLKYPLEACQVIYLFTYLPTYLRMTT